MDPLDEHFASKVADLCFKSYNKLGKKGKPQQGKEWTKFAAIILTDSSGSIHVVSMATGTKCLGEKQRTATGMLLNDSHAEVLARRLFLRYIYKQLEGAVAGESSIFDKCDRKGVYTLKSGFSFHLLSSDVPCGDASIFPKINSMKEDVEDKKRESQKRKHLIDEVSDLREVKKSKCNVVSDTSLNSGLSEKHCTESQNSQEWKNYPVEDNSFSQSSIDAASLAVQTDLNASWNTTSYVNQNQRNTSQSIPRSADINDTGDIHRTGAKCVHGGEQDLLEEGDAYHVTGALRIKPGRGDRTLSMSCSDKIMKWTILGLQGGLLSNFISKPIFLSSIIVCKGPYDPPALSRALSLRGRSSPRLHLHTPILLQANVRFPHGKEACLETIGSEENVNPCGASLLWCGTANIHEVTSVGRKHGITKKKINSPDSMTPICKLALFTCFSQLVKLHAKMKSNSLWTDFSVGSYRDCKRLSVKHVTSRQGFFEVFPDWTQKPDDHENFP